MSHIAHNKKALLARVRRIQGQAAALEKAIEAETECVAVLQQIAAVRGAVNGLMGEVLEGHLRDHVADGEMSAKQRAAELEDVISVVRSYVK